MIIIAQTGKPAVIGKNNQWFTIRIQHISSCHQTGIKFEAEQIGNGRQDIGTINRVSNDDAVFSLHCCRPDDKRVMAIVHIGFRSESEHIDQVCFYIKVIHVAFFIDHIIIRKTVWIVVTGHDDNGVLQNTSLFQLRKQIFQRFFEFQICGNIT